jgi:NADH-quinone oxidoreductase subunit J
MTTRPRMIPLGKHLLPGLIAVALFGIFAATFLTAEFADAAEFADVSIVAGIGYALIGEPAAAGAEAVYQNTESFLIALFLIAILLDAALDGALMLAKRDDGGEKR